MASPSEIEILERVLMESKVFLSAEAAQVFLAAKFSKADRENMQHLAEKARQGTLTRQERKEAESYERAGHLLATLKSRARKAMKSKKNRRAKDRALPRKVGILPDLYAFLQAVKQRDSMYLRNKSLNELQTMLHGYSMALQAHGIEEFGTDFNRRFGEYVWQRFRGASAWGWAYTITNHSRSVDAALERFFDLVEEFRAASR